MTASRFAISMQRTLRSCAGRSWAGLGPLLVAALALSDAALAGRGVALAQVPLVPPLPAPVLAAPPLEPPSEPAPTLAPTTPGPGIAAPVEPETPAPALDAYRRGLDLLYANTPREAAESFELALAHGYRPPEEAYLRLGLAYRDVPLRKFQAIRAFRRAMRVDTPSPEALYGYADTYLELDGWEGQREARRALVRLLREEPLYHDAYARWRGLWPDRDEQIGLAATLRARLRESFDARVAALAGDIYVQAGAANELDRLLSEWSSLERPPSAAYHYYRARLLFARGSEAEATASWLAGLDAVRARQDLAPYEDDLDPLLSDADRELQAARTIGERVAFVRAFWVGRDPLPFSDANERLAEQYRRVEQVRKRYLWKKPLAKEKVLGAYVDDLGRPSFETRLEGRSVDDRGTIYLRHGEPGWRNVEVGGAEYWRYDRPGLPDGKLQFHFKLMDGPMGRGNDTVYSITPTTEIGEANVRRGHAGREGVANTLLGLGSDSYAHDYGARVLPLAATGATFRSAGSASRTDLLLAVGVPLSRLRALEGTSAGLALRLKLYDADYREEVALADTMRLMGGEGEAGSLVGAFAITSYPGQRRYAAQVEGLAEGSIGLQRGEMLFPSYAGRHLQLSDVLFASRVSPSASDPTAPRREGFAIRPLLGPGLDRTVPLHLYYEVYDLAAGEDGRARWRVEYRVAPESPVTPGLLKRVFGADGGASGESGGEVALAFEKERRGAAERVPETISLDLSVLPPGRYRVTVSVRDASSGTEASRVVVLDLGEGGGSAEAGAGGPGAADSARGGEAR